MTRIRRIANCLFLATFLANSAHAQGAGQKTFSSSQEALTAFIQAVRDGNPSELGAILGPGTEQVVASSDSVADKASREAFLKWYGQGHSLVPSGKGEFTLQVGKDGWPLPIPLAHSGDKWYWDGIAGKDEILLSAHPLTMSSRPSVCTKVSSPRNTTTRVSAQVDNPQAPMPPASSANQVNGTDSVGR
jgi:hypothetical protein